MGQNKGWAKNGDCYELHFVVGGKDNIILKMVEDKKEPNRYIYVSDLLKVEFDDVYATNVEIAKSKLEEQVVDYILDKINYYEELLRKWEE